MHYRRLFLELLVQSLPSKKKISSKDIFSWFGISVKPGNSALALIFQCISFRLIIRPKVLDLIVVKSVGDILFNLDHYLEILFRIELDFFGFSMMASYDLLNLPNFPLDSFRHPAAWIWLLSPKKWKIKGPASLQWDWKKGKRKRAVIKHQLLPTPNQAITAPVRCRVVEEAICKKKKCEGLPGPCTCVVADPGDGSGGENKRKEHWKACLQPANAKLFVPPYMHLKLQNPPWKTTKVKLPFLSKMSSQRSPRQTITPTMLPALPSPPGFLRDSPFIVVTDSVFQALMSYGLDESRCQYMDLSSDMRDCDVYSWLPDGQCLWFIPSPKEDMEILTDCDLKMAESFPELQARRTEERDEGQCVIALANRNFRFGYHAGEFFREWKEV